MSIVDWCAEEAERRSEDPGLRDGLNHAHDYMVFLARISIGTYTGKKEIEDRLKEVYTTLQAEREKGDLARTGKKEIEDRLKEVYTTLQAEREKVRRLREALEYYAHPVAKKTARVEIPLKCSIARKILKETE